MIFSAYRPVVSRTALFSLLFMIVLGMGLAGQVRAQDSFPRIGLSTSQDVYESQITVLNNTDFKLYVMVFGGEDGTPLQEPLVTIPWVIHQVCCGAVLTITAAEFNPALEHTGNPLAGTVTTAPTCVIQDSIWLATLTVRMESSIPGDFEWASGPLGPILNCNDESQFVHGLAVTVTMDETATPNELGAWGQIKAMYR